MALIEMLKNFSFNFASQIKGFRILFSNIALRKL